MSSRDLIHNHGFRHTTTVKKNTLQFTLSFTLVLFHKMKFISSLLVCLLVSVGWLMTTSVVVVEATTLTYQLQASEKACFYVWVDQPGKKVAFYFAVSESVVLVVLV